MLLAHQKPTRQSETETQLHCKVTHRPKVDGVGLEKTQPDQLLAMQTQHRATQVEQESEAETHRAELVELVKRAVTALPKTAALAAMGTFGLTEITMDRVEALVLGLGARLRLGLEQAEMTEKVEDGTTAATTARQTKVLVVGAVDLLLDMGTQTLVPVAPALSASDILQKMSMMLRSHLPEHKP